MINLKSKILNLPSKPGVYIFKDKKAQVLYVGKAKNLKTRVKQYFGKGDERPQIPFLIKEAADLDYTVVNTELESLYLERTLINQYLPKYNIELKDDKNFAFITIDYNVSVPQISYTRNIDLKNKKVKYFGPYTSAKKIKNTLLLTRKIFSYCSAKKISKNPCFHYHLHRCPGICVGKINLAEYKKQLNNISLFLSGNISKTKSEIRKEMDKASKIKKFEAAARLRDQLKSLEILEQKQNVILTKKVNWDLVSLAQIEEYACINLFKIREGKMIDKENFIYKSKWQDLHGHVNPADEILQTFLENYYLTANDIPKTIYIENKVTNKKLTLTLLKKRSKKKVEILVPQKGKTKKLTKLGQMNAEEYLKNYLRDQTGNKDKINEALKRLKEVLKLTKIPKRIEGYDISNISGTNPVGSMVVFIDGVPAKSEYRKFKIQNKNTPDDFAMIREMITRRFGHSNIVSKTKQSIPKKKVATSRQVGTCNNKKNWAIPDLVVIDGGRGQLNVALKILNTKRYTLKTIPIIGLAKKLEEIYIPGKMQPIRLPHTNPALQMLQRLRDEAHRFGIVFHRKLRNKEAFKSRLDEISGIGPKTKKLLKQKLGTIAVIKQTNFNKLKKIVGEKKAKIIKEEFH